jgi:hypothetical protein
MANSFAVSSSRRTAGPEGKSYIHIIGILTVDTPGGAAADDLPASLFGLSKIVDVGNIVPDSEDAMFAASPDYTGDSVLVMDNDAASQALADLPADSYRVSILGY